MRSLLLVLLIVGFPLAAFSQSPFYDAHPGASSLPLTGGTLTGSVNLSGNDLWCVDDIEPTTTCELAADSAATSGVIRTGQDAWPLATVNTGGGDICISAGEGASNVTIDTYTNCATDTVTVTINGVASVLTEGAQWTAATSNAATCTSLCSAIDALTGVSCSACVGAVAPIKRDAGCYGGITVATSDATCDTVANGTDGLVRLPSEVLFGGSGAASAGFRLANAGGTVIIYNGSKSTTGSLYANQIGTYSTSDAAFQAAGTGGGFRTGSTGKFCHSDNASGGSGTSDTCMSRVAAGIEGFTGALQIAEMTAPAAGAANTARIFAQDNGGGKTQLCVQFASGAAQCFATEP